MAKSGKKRGGGGAVVRIKPQKPIVYVLSCSGVLLGASALFSLFGFIFLAIDNAAAQIAMSFVFLIPVGVLAYFTGSGAADRDFRIKCQEVKPEDKDRRPVDVKPQKGVFYVLPFAGLLLFLSLSACIFNWLPLQTAMIFLTLPLSLLFIGTGAFSLPMEHTTWLSFVSILIYVILVAGAYAVGYILASKTLRNRQAKLITEIRSVRR
ncbi:MAG: hypothetical protein LBH24_04625 [Clostridiales bacterium]|jgi:uncharacterized membrane protein|nr:hypothetical protein [Clostridiales bacterium]